MQPIQINVNVSIGLNDELTGLCGLIAAALVKSANAAPAYPKGGETPEPTEEGAESPLLVPQEPIPAKGEPDAVRPEAKPIEKQYTEVDVRAAMDATRKRIEGPDYKENTTGEGYQKYHRVLTAWFKETAALFGAEKPSALPDSESRGKFIAACEKARVDDNGTITDCPF